MRFMWMNGMARAFSLRAATLAVVGVLAVFDISAMGDETAEKANRFERWLPAMRKFEKQDKENPPAPGGIVFVGSSSIRLWDLEKWFDEVKPTPLNRGFGGSQLVDATHFADLLVLKHKPRTIVVYSGDNDIAGGKSAEQVENDFAAFCKKVHDALPKARILFVAIKPSPSRWKYAEVQRDANARVRQRCKADERLEYVDVWSPMLGEDGQPRRKLFRDDMLHLNDAGYKLWSSLVSPKIGD